MGGVERASELGFEAAGVVLVVEDEWLLRADISEFLRSRGLRVIEAATGEEATSVLSSGEPVDVVFCDVQLPGRMGGISFSVWAKAHCPEVPVILTSGNATIAKRLGRGSAAPFIAKPYDPDHVANEILRLVGARRLPHS